MRKSWALPFHALKPMARQSPEQHAVERVSSRRSTRTIEPRWWRVRYFRGMVNDIKRRAPFYWSDWKDAWDYRVVPATVYMYFAK
jgi:hypothetical protein